MHSTYKTVSSHMLTVFPLLAAAVKEFLSQYRLVLLHEAGIEVLLCSPVPADLPESFCFP